jgi:phosphoribosyl 1,2-cyclic phosphodiesterase
LLTANNGQTLIIEAGVRFDTIKKALQYNLRNVVGCIITHEHKDHCKAAESMMLAGINCYSTAGTLDAIGVKSHRAMIIGKDQIFSLGDFRLKAFGVKHDVSDPVGYLINHEECGTVLFLTDTYYCEYTFPPLNNILVEANYCQKILDDRLKRGENPKVVRDRVIESHLSIDNCKALLKANDLSKVNNIVLIHLSDKNSDEKRFKREVEELTGKTVHIAEAGLEIDHFNDSPF